MKHARGDLIALFAVAALALAGQREATADPCKTDGQVCRTSRSCCGTSGNNGVCVRGGQKFGLCCTQTGNDTNCDGRDDDCDGVADDGYVATATTCGAGDCASAGSLVCESGSPRDTCDPAATNGLDCSDGNVCTDSDTCQNGTCTGTPVPGCCRDDSDCTPPETCMSGTCSCTAATCTATDCGPTSDGCGDTLNCPCSRCAGACSGTDPIMTVTTVCGGCTESGCDTLCVDFCAEHGRTCVSASCESCDP